ncbi:MAG: galactokinase [Ruminococcaceae bacterium]|nr:galactokinase [Oscillospiraceae bacterium]
MNISELIQELKNGAADQTLVELYGAENLATQKERYLAAIREFEKLYGDRENVGIYSVSGRSELSGNHTDHNHGCVIAASIDLDILAVAAKTNENRIRLKSEGFGEDTVDFASFSVPDETKFGTSASLIAGMCQGFLKEGHKIGGFVAYTTSNVLKGSGLSSSAAFEDMIGNILNHTYNDGRVSNVEIAKLAQYAENVFFGKPCGLMDQVACAAGGIVAIDFASESAPVIENIAADMTDYKLCIVNTGGNHADLTEDYAAIPAEMKAIASHFGKPYLREIEEKDVLAELPALRKGFCDRAILRALHFFAENRRVAEQKQALLRGDLDCFLEKVIESGRSSFCYLQNVYTTKNVREQGLSLALCLAEGYLSGKKAAWRVHGGGFAGTVQSFIRQEDVEGYRALMDAAFGEGACIVLRIRPHGALRVL